MQQVQAVRQGVRCFLLRDGSGEGMDVDGIAVETETLSVKVVSVLAVAVVAARATACTNVVAVGDEGLGLFAAVLDLDGSAALETGTGSAGLELMLRVGSFLQYLKCCVNPAGLVVVKRRWQCGHVVQHSQTLWQGFLLFALIDVGRARSVASGFGAAAGVDGRVLPKRRRRREWSDSRSDDVDDEDADATDEEEA